jgi:hypothetical protein
MFTLNGLNGKAGQPHTHRRASQAHTKLAHLDPAVVIIISDPV